MQDLDHALDRLAMMPVPADLWGIDQAVLADLAARQREAAATPRMLSAAATVSLLVGALGGSALAGQPAVAEPLSPFSLDNPLAPSTLLGVGE
jgi:hypothetical protein